MGMGMEEEHLVPDALDHFIFLDLGGQKGPG